MSLFVSLAIEKYGSIFESYVISELLKDYMNRRLEHAIYFWRDSTGNDLDVTIDG